MRHGQRCRWQGLLSRGLLGWQCCLRGRWWQGRVRVSLRGLGREAEGLRGARVLQQRPRLQGVGARGALTVQRGLGMRWGGGLAGWPGQRLQWGVWGGKPLWVQGRRLLDVGVGSGSLRLAGGLGG